MTNEQINIEIEKQAEIAEYEKIAMVNPYCI